MIIDKPFTSIRIYVLFLLTSELFSAHLDGSVSSYCSDRITANKANVIRPCKPSAPLLTTDPFFDLVIWQLGFINQTQLPAWLTIFAVHHCSFMVSGLSVLIFVHYGNSLTADIYCTSSSLGLLRCFVFLTDKDKNMAFIWLYCLCVTASRPNYTFEMLLLDCES